MEEGLALVPERAERMDVMKEFSGKVLKALAGLCSKNHGRYNGIRVKAGPEGKSVMLATDGRVLAKIVIEGNGVDAFIPLAVAKSVKAAAGVTIRGRTLRAGGAAYDLPDPAEHAFPDVDDVIPPAEPAEEHSSVIGIGPQYMAKVGSFMDALHGYGTPAVRARFQGPDKAIRFDLQSVEEPIESVTVALMPVSLD